LLLGRRRHWLHQRQKNTIARSGSISAKSNRIAHLSVMKIDNSNVIYLAKQWIFGDGVRNQACPSDNITLSSSGGRVMSYG